MKAMLASLYVCAFACFAPAAESERQVPQHGQGAAALVGKKCDQRGTLVAVQKETESITKRG